VSTRRVVPAALLLGLAAWPCESLPAVAVQAPAAGEQAMAPAAGDGTPVAGEGTSAAREGIPATGEAACAGVSEDLRAAEDALANGRWVEAEQRLRPLAASCAGCSQVALGLARARAAQGDATVAERLFEQAAALAPGSARANALFAQHWLSRGQPARADYLAARALALDPDCLEALVARGRLLAARGRIPEAVQDLEKAVGLAPGDPEARYQLGVLLYRRLLHLRAAAELEKAVATRPADARAHGYLAQSYEAVGKPGEAEAAYGAGLKANDEAKDGPFFDPFLDYHYGRFLLTEKRLEESRARLDRAAALRPADRAVRYERAKLGLARGDLAAAREDAERALAARGGPVLDLQVYYLLATIYRRLGEADLARRYADLARTTPIPGQ
jgi:tetratricopeptide (TPR) repeat protein